MSITETIWQLLTGAVVIAIIYVLVRPSSNAGQAVQDIGNALAALIKTAAGSQPSQ